MSENDSKNLILVLIIIALVALTCLLNSCASEPGCNDLSSAVACRQFPRGK